ncbi:uncharacterized protein LOC103570355 isoform X2 [Microplitis demolitor]|nr:uncharacterized protein LOC103570355 isoform X2 [Microplitis demolitor]
MKTFLSPQMIVSMTLAVKYTTKKKLIEDAGILGAEVTHEVSAVLNLLTQERAKTKNLEAAISKISKEYDLQEIKLKNCRCDEDTTKRPGLSLLAGLEQRNINRKSGGERYTNEEILFAIGIYKRSPKCYRFLMNYILLPSEITMRRAFIILDLKPGINNSIIEGLKKAAERMTDPLDRYCTVVMDESSIKPRLSYTVGIDSFGGFHDDGNGVQKAELADHATVFMLQQINKPGKQPLSFHFTHKPMNTSVLKALLTQILSLIVAAEMIPVAAVSDQGSTNREAFNLLKDETPNNYESNHFKINNYANKIYILYDIAHLIKTLKNNFAGAFENWFAKNPKKSKQEYPGNIIEINGIRGYWREIVNYFFQDEKCHFKEEHVFPTNKVKMGVRFASQVLSQMTAERLMQRAVADPIKNVAAKATSIIIKFLDMVIDSLNGCKLSGGDKKESSSRANVTSTSQHWEFWPKAKKAISTLKFFRPDGKLISTPTPAVLLNSLSAISDLCQFLFKAGFKSINLRHLTQDGLENFFGLIKNLQGCNHKLTTTHFISAFKTSILTIFSDCNVRGANSEIESSPTIIQLQNLLTIKSNKHSSSHDKNVEDIEQEITEADDVPRLQLDDTDDNCDDQLNLIFGGANEGLDNDLFS